MLKDFREGAAMRGFRHVPFGDHDAHGLQEVCRTSADTAKRADHDGIGPSVRHIVQLSCKICDQRILVCVDTNGTASLTALLCGPAFQRDRRTRIAGPIAESSNPAAVFLDQIFQIVKRTAALAEPAQELLAGVLSLEGMAEHDVAMRQGGAILGQLFETKDDRVPGRFRPAVFRRDLATRIDIALQGQRPD